MFDAARQISLAAASLVLAGFATLAPGVAHAVTPVYGLTVGAGAQAYAATDNDQFSQDNGATSGAVTAEALYQGGSLGVVKGSGAGSANLATGELKAFGYGSKNCASGVCLYGVGAGDAMLHDTLSFNIPGATAATITPIEFTFNSVGLVTGADFYHFLGIRLNSDNAPQDANISGYYNFGTVETNATGPAAVDWILDSPDFFSVKATYDLVGANPSLWFQMQLFIVANNGTEADFMHTADVALKLPDGVTYTSASGVFLSEAVSAVPEPASWAMMIMGFGALGSAMRSRRRAMAMAMATSRLAA